MESLLSQRAILKIVEQLYISTLRLLLPLNYCITIILQSSRSCHIH